MGAVSEGAQDWSRLVPIHPDSMAMNRHACSTRRPLPPRPSQANRRTDSREEAQEHLATPTAMYREMGMTYWLEKGEAEMTKPGG
jgi:hypothetical protein